MICFRYAAVVVSVVFQYQSDAVPMLLFPLLFHVPLLCILVVLLLFYWSQSFSIPAGMLIILGLFRKVNIFFILLLPVRLVDPILLPGSCCQIHIVLQWSGFWRFGLFFEHGWVDDLLFLLLSLLMFHCLIDVVLGF